MLFNFNWYFGKSHEAEVFEQTTLNLLWVVVINPRQVFMKLASFWVRDVQITRTVSIQSTPHRYLPDYPGYRRHNFSQLPPALTVLLTELCIPNKPSRKSIIAPVPSDVNTPISRPDFAAADADTFKGVFPHRNSIFLLCRYLNLRD